MRFVHVPRATTLPVAFAMLVSCSPSHPVTDAKPVASANLAEVRPVQTPASPISAAASASSVTVVDALPRAPTSLPNAKPDHVIEVVTTDGRACAIFDNGMLQCWGGFNFKGELGHGHKGKPAMPNWVKGIRGVKKVSLARNSSCAVVDSGELFCWGENNFLESDTRSEFTTPIRVPDLSGVVDVDVSDRHGCAVVNSGAMYCWGNNNEGQLGFGAAEVGKTFKKPMQVAGIVDAVGVVVSDSITIAWTKSGELYRWGTASDPSRHYASATPRKMAIISGAKQAKVDMQQACALLAAGEVRCFSHETLQDFLAGKEHDFGPELAELVSAISRKKVDSIPKNFVYPDGRGISGVIDMAVFNHDASAVTDKGEVYSWGSAERGTVGRPERTKGFFPPTLIQGFTNAIAIAGSFRHRCALEKGGEVRCFGDHVFLGVDSPNDSTSAVVVKGLPKISHIASNEDCTFALAEDYSLWAWGDNVTNACGWADGDNDSPLPARVAIVKTAP
jgi:alpha-tubulin suppressor-like RCC1 family protein